MSPSAAVSAAFLAIVASLVVVAALAARAAAGRRAAAVTVAVVAAWLALLAVLAGAGVLRDFEAQPPRLALLVVPPVLACVLLAALRPSGPRLAALPVWALTGYQAFRIAMELVLHGLHEEGVIPVQMTYLGRNFDVLTGLAAIPVALLAWRGRLPRWGLVAFNLMGMALLANIVTVAILSTPYPFRRFHEGPANEVIFSWPFCWLPAFVVPMALLGHLVCLRAAWSERPA